jgi:hypothetical protein
MRLASKNSIDGCPGLPYGSPLALGLIPVGEHIVELRYEPWNLQVGMKISPVGYAALTVLAFAARAHHRRKIVGGKEPTTFRGGGQ